ncbi:hypothetical protein D3C77_513500 [compost metagenome]
MAVKQIEGDLARLLRVASQLFADCMGKILGVECTPYNKVENRIRERIVHDSVELIALQPTGRLMPDFTQNIRVRVGLFHHFTKISPELVIHLISDI